MPNEDPLYFDWDLCGTPVLHKTFHWRDELNLRILIEVVFARHDVCLFVFRSSSDTRYWSSSLLFLVPFCYFAVSCLLMLNNCSSGFIRFTGRM